MLTVYSTGIPPRNCTSFEPFRWTQRTCCPRVSSMLTRTSCLIPRVRSDRTGLRIVGTPATVDAANGVDVHIAVHVRGDALGGTMTVSTGLVWVAGARLGPLAPGLPGSQLWSDEFRCALEGLAARFPISPVAFSSLPTLDPDAAWTLDWEPTQLDDPVLGAVRLLVNTEHPRVRESVVSGSREPGADVVRALIHFDVARTLVTSALENPEFVERVDAYPDESVGRTIADLIRSHWNESPAALAARHSRYPRRFEMELQARFRPVPMT